MKSHHNTDADALLDAPKLIGRAPEISKEFGEYEVAAALRQALSEKSTGLTSTPGYKRFPHGRRIKVKFGDRQDERVEFTRTRAVAIIGVHGIAANRYSSQKV